MTQVIVQHFELESIPQATPRAAKHPIDKLAPQLTKGGFHLLAHVAEDEAMGGGLVPGNQQHVGLFRQGCGTLRAAIAQIPQGDAPVYGLDQDQGGNTIIAIARRQDNIEDPPVNVAEQMAFETKEPAFAAFPKVGPVLAQQPDPPMPDRLAEGNGLAVPQIQAGGLPRMGTGRGQQPADLGPQMVHARHPLLVGGQLGKGGPPVLGDQPIGLFERGNFKGPLQQGNRQHFGIAEVRLGVRRATPLGEAGMGFQEVVYHTIEFGHLMLYARLHRSSPSGEQSQRSRFDSTLPLRIDDLVLSTRD